VKLSTLVPFPIDTRKLSHGDHLLFMGSCFSEHIGGWMGELQMDALANPTGIIYNPISLAQHLRYCLGEGTHSMEPPFREKLRSGLETSQGLYVHCDFHSQFAAPDAETCADNIAKGMSALADSLVRADVLFITFGTAMVYTKKDGDAVVNNCHKIDASAFAKRLATLQELSEAMGQAIAALRQNRPEIEVYLTVSPVRHLRHGAVDNQRSKARLLLLCEVLCSTFTKVHYLPVYEFVMDELRDYRYYRYDDLLHLNEAGLLLLQERIASSLFDQATSIIVEKVKRWQQMKNHRLLHPDTAASHAFVEKFKKETKALESILGRKIK
jgi:hypothetical protein